MTDEQKNIFINWLERVIEATKTLQETYRGYESEDFSFAGHCISPEVHLTLDAFRLLVGINDCVVIETEVKTSWGMYDKYETEYKGTTIVALGDMKNV